MDLRTGAKSDAAALLEIDRPYVQDTAISLELTAPSVGDFAGRIDKATRGWAWLVAEQDGRCIGYVYASMHRERPAYRFSVETSTYVDAAYHRRGVARALYAELFSILRAKGFCNAFAAVTLPNPASLALHQGVGFSHIGIFASVRYIFGR